MWAVTITEGALEWSERPDPVPGDGELLVAVRAAGVNAADLMQRRGRYPAPAGSPADIPGLELAGEVLAVGSKVTTFSAGDAVMAVVGGGAQAELAVVDERVAMAVPPELDWVAAGAFPEAFCTAHDALFRQCRLTMGERVLVTGAAGGVGSTAVQLASVAGAEVVASARHASTHRSLLDLGANVAATPDDALQHGPFDVVVDMVGGPGLNAVVDALRTGGRVAVVGVGAGSTTELNLLGLMSHRASISGATLRARSLNDKGAVVGAVAREVLPLVSAGRFRVPIAATVPMDRAGEAYDQFAAGGKFGKIVLVGSS